MGSSEVAPQPVTSKDNAKRKVFKSFTIVLVAFCFLILANSLLAAGLIQLTRIENLFETRTTQMSSLESQLEAMDKRQQEMDTNINMLNQDKKTNGDPGKLCIDSGTCSPQLASGRGQLGATGLWEAGTTALVKANRVGKAMAAVSVYEPVRRRLRENRHGRKLTSIAEVDATTCSDLLEAAVATGDYSGTVSFSGEGNSTTIKSGSADEYTTDSTTGSLAATVSGDGYSFTVNRASDADACVVLKESRRSLEELVLTEHDHAMLRRRRLEESSTGSNVSSPESLDLGHMCVVYHCFEGDADCPDPSPDHVCLVRGNDGRCATPLCRWGPAAEEKGVGDIAVRIQHLRRRTGDCTGENAGYPGCECTSTSDCADEYWCRNVNGGVCSECFPASAKVTREDDTVVAMHTLIAGDRILAADPQDGTLRFDTVSIMSMVAPHTETPFVSLTAQRLATEPPAAGGPKDGEVTLQLTHSHHLAVGHTCCSTLKQADDVVVGDTVWAVANSKDGALSAHVVVAKELTTNVGMYSPVLIEGGLPVVDGMATSFDTAAHVRASKWWLPRFEWALSGSAVRIAFETLKCIPRVEQVVADRVLGGEAYSSHCRKTEFIDGLVVDGAETAAKLTSWLSTALTSLIIAAAIRVAMTTTKTFTQ